jgi:hypothetical protein
MKNLPRKNDYLVIQLEKKRHLVQVIKSKEKLVGVIDGPSRSSPNTQQTIDIKDDMIVANLGPEPVWGSAYGVKIEPYKNTEHLKPWGDIHYFLGLEEHERSRLIKNLTLVSDKLREMGLTHHLPIEIHIRPPKGKYHGWYKKHRGESLDTMTLMPADWDNKSLRYIIAHEIGHYVEFNFFTPRVKKMWIKAYHDFVRLKNIPDEFIKNSKEKIEESKEIDSVYQDLDEEDQGYLDVIFGWVEEHHHLTAEHLDTLLATGNSLTPYWPNVSLSSSDVEVVVTDYAKKNPEELWAEAFAHHVNKIKIPKKK